MDHCPYTIGLWHIKCHAGFNDPSSAARTDEYVAEFMKRFPAGEAQLSEVIEAFPSWGMRMLRSLECDWRRGLRFS